MRLATYISSIETKNMASPEERFPNPAFPGPAINNPSYRRPMPSPPPRLLDFSSPKNRTNPSLHRRGIWTGSTSEPRDFADQGELIKLPRPNLSIQSTHELNTEVDTEEKKRDLITALHRSDSININFKTPYSLVLELENQTYIFTGVSKHLLDLCLSSHNLQNSSPTCYENNNVGCTANNPTIIMDLHNVCSRHENYRHAEIKCHWSRVSRSSLQENSNGLRNHQKIHELSCAYNEIVFLTNPEFKHDSEQISMGERSIQYRKFTVNCYTPVEIDYRALETLKWKTMSELPEAPWQTIAFSLNTLNEQNGIHLCGSFALALVLISAFSQLAILFFFLYQYVVRSFSQQKYIEKTKDLSVHESQIAFDIV
ncbi:hypothetical protein Golomagni_00020 [Golovinomyces magnicellulatus]|nr:hypothetical protein Golomagni_00020 [Golovinomyces magnicellulatus]